MFTNLSYNFTPTTVMSDPSSSPSSGSLELDLVPPALQACPLPPPVVAAPPPQEQATPFPWGEADPQLERGEQEGAFQLVEAIRKGANRYTKPGARGVTRTKITQRGPRGRGLEPYPEEDVAQHEWEFDPQPEYTGAKAQWLEERQGRGWWEADWSRYDNSAQVGVGWWAEDYRWRQGEKRWGNDQGWWSTTNRTDHWTWNHGWKEQWTERRWEPPSTAPTPDPEPKADLWASWNMNPSKKVNLKSTKPSKLLLLSVLHE